MGAHSETASTKWKDFNSINEEFEIEFHNDKDTINIVSFKSKKKHAIELSEKWKEWKCDTKKANKQCEAVQKGIFAWGGKYKITFLPSNFHNNFVFKFLVKN